MLRLPCRANLFITLSLLFSTYLRGGFLLKFLKRIITGLVLVSCVFAVEAAPLYSCSRGVTDYVHSSPSACWSQGCEATVAGNNTESSSATGSITTIYHEFSARCEMTITYLPSGVQYTTGFAIGSSQAFNEQSDCKPGEYVNIKTGYCGVTPDYFINPDFKDKYGLPKTCAGNPCDPLTGNKFQVEHDYLGQGPQPLRFDRFYNSMASTQRHWKHTYDRKVTVEYGHIFNSPATSGSSTLYQTKQSACELGWAQVKSTVTQFSTAATTAQWLDGQCKVIENGRVIGTFPVYTNSYYSGQLANQTIAAYHVTRPDGKSYRFSSSDLFGRFKAVTSGTEYINDNNSTEKFDASGKLIAITSPAGLSQTLSYNTSNQLSSVTDFAGKSLTFEYDAQGNLIKLNTPTADAIQYEWLAVDKLSKITHPDLTTRQYVYENTNHPLALTGIIDEANIRYASWSYDLAGRATASTHANNAERVDITYNTDNTRTITNSLGSMTQYAFITQNGEKLISSITGPGCVTCGTRNTHFTYDGKNNILSKTVDGLTTEYGNYDANDNYTYVIEAAGTTEARRKDFTYDPRFVDKIATVTEPSVFTANKKVTTVIYDNFAHPIQISIDGFKPGSTAIRQTVSTQYLGPLNQLSKFDGPRNDVIDTVIYAYYPDDVTQGNNRARLKSISRAGLVVRDNIQYTATGKILSEQRLNGISYLYRYYPGNDRLETLTLSDGTETRVTRWTYLATGEVQSITLGHGTALATTITLSYDDARRLTRITDGLGNYINYSLDTENNQTNKAVYDNTGVLQRSLSQTFDIYSNLDTTSQANELVDYNFNADGSLDTTTDGNGTLSQYGYDAIKRLTTISNDVGGLDANTQDTMTQIGYDVHDRATSITDPNHGNTTYSYDDFGNLLSQTSPDSGTTTYTYDLANNLLSRTDANGITLSYTYDALNRLTSLTAPDVTNNVSYEYDTCTNGQGRLCRLTKNNRVTTYSYNAFGDITAHQGVAYQYDSLGRIQSQTYPSGNILSYQYNLAGQINNISLNDGTTTTALASNLQYTPFGPLNNLTYGNGLTLNQSHDSAYRLLNQTISGIQQQDYDLYDGNGNIKSISDSLSLQTSLFNYDALNRLNSASNTNASQANWNYQYDRNGNRSQSSDGTNTSNGVYSANSNRLQSWGTKTITLDAVGNTLSDGKHTYGYDQHHRLTSIDSNISYQYNALGQRIQKTVNGTITNYVYGLNGELLGEYDASGQTKTEYVYLNGQPLALTRPGSVPVKQAVDKIIDNSDPGASSSGSWTSCSVAGYYGPDCFYLYAGTGSNTFSWTAALEPGEYDVYEWHVSTTVSTTAAPYTISHANGVTSVPINQQINSGQWNRIGTFTFGSTGQVMIDDSASDGLVVADAVRFVRVVNNPGSARIIDNTDPGASSIGNWNNCTVAGYYGPDCFYLYAGTGSNTFSWSTSLEPGQYDVFEWHVATTVSTTVAPYQISHADGITSVSGNQTINAGQWNLLGNFRFTSSGQVSLDDSASDGLVVADAVNFVRTDTPSQAKILYLHNDHLGTPRRATDSTGKVVWRWDSEAFGHSAAVDDPDGDGVATTINLRFAGQYFDNESGLHYNYFRYYDPRIGRYITSDPIGLAGGLNTYGYVGGNPVGFIDPFGLLNPAKAVSAVGNAAIAGVTAASGAGKIAIAIGLSPASATGVGALPPAALGAWGAWNLKGSYAAYKRGLQQFKESLCEDWDDASWQNFYGMLPKGTEYDDANDQYSNPWEYISNKGWWEFLKDAGYF